MLTILSQKVGAAARIELKLPGSEKIWGKSLTKHLIKKTLFLNDMFVRTWLRGAAKEKQFNEGPNELQITTFIG